MIKIKAKNHISQNLSSTTLFSFTYTLDFLLDNLEHGFYVNHIYEKLPFRKIGYIVPMRCFCDIPLGMIKTHLVWYGNYGLGIKRKYARSHGVCPVWYIHSDSREMKSLISRKNLDGLKSNSFLPYFKQFYGNQKNYEGITQKIKFYDEREWRYIPKEIKAEVLLDKTESEIEAIRKNKNGNKILRMPIPLNEVEYIIVNDSKDLKILLPALKRLASKNQDVSYELLVSKILTSKQIQKDF
ncbi:MAG: hypothetical protein IPP51_00750 [Bacteroidetes bacterium]|nr:hypothetical protein [Bacteroidota bacterium]